MRNILLLLLIQLVSAATWAQVPGAAPAQGQGIVIANATLHIGNGEVIEKGFIAFDKGKIVSVGKENPNLAGFKVIEANGKQIYPGLILPNSILGLEEISAVRASNDYAETGDMNPNVRSIIAYNTDSELIGTLRFNGILIAQTAPQGGLISGTSSIVQLDAWNWEDAAYKLDDGIYLNWPRKLLPPRWWMGETEMRVNEEYGRFMNEFEKLLTDAKAYMETTPHAVNLKLASLKGIFDGNQTLFIRAGLARETMEACNIVKRLGVKRVVVVGGNDAWLMTDYLRENQIAVIVDNVHRLPTRQEEDVDMPYRIPAILKKAGVKFCLGYEGRNASSRNLPFLAGTAVAYGLTPEEALQSITKDAAEILGISDRTGMLAVGLDANIVVSEGDLLDMRTSKVTHAFIQGRAIQLPTKQEVLFEKYQQKYKNGK